MENKKHISPSQIKIYLECGKKYYYRYVEGRKPLRLHSSIPFGRAFHSAVAEFNIMRKLKREKPSIVIALFKENLKKELELSETPVEMEMEIDKMTGTGEKMLNLYMDFLKSRNTEVLHVEFPVEYPIENTDYLFEGVVDTVEETDSGLEVVEIKTSSKKWAVDTHIYDVQAPFYRNAIEKIYPEKGITVRFDIITKGKNPQLTSRYSSGKRNLEKEVISGVIDGIEKGVFVPKPGYHCRLCGYRELCMEDENEEIKIL